MAEFSVASAGTGGITNGLVYGWSLSFFGLTGTVTGASVSLTGLSHAFPDDLDFALIAPNDINNLVFLSDAGGDTDISAANLTITDAAASMAPDTGILTSGLYKPTNYGADETAADLGFLGTIHHAGPAGGATFASAFGGTAPNGVWKLAYRDDAAGDNGSLAGFGLTITTSSNAVVISGSGGGDTITVAATGAGSGFYALAASVVRFSGVTSLRLNGGGGSDTINGSAFNETLDGGPGNDFLNGGRGNDTYVLGAELTGADNVADSGGTADLILSSIARNLGSYTTIENLTLYGRAAVSGTGNGLNNTITGNAAANVLNGMGGNDKLYGAGGRDTLTGGTGNDTFVYRSAAESRGTTFDIIRDFDDSGNDRIDLSAVHGGKLKFIGDYAFTGAGQVRINDVAGADVVVEVNTGGSLAADMTIRLTGPTLASMTATDFVL